MRDANAQRANIMVPVSAMQQPSTPHVSHAETGGLEHDPEKWVPVFRRDHAQTKR
jgi:hypothetical protein